MRIDRISFYGAMPTGKFIGIAQETISRLAKEGKVTDIGAKQSAKIDMNLAEEFKKIKIVSNQKQSGSAKHIADMESRSILV